MNSGLIKNACSPALYAEKFLRVFNDTCNKYQITIPIYYLCLFVRFDHGGGKGVCIEEPAIMPAYKGIKNLGHAQLGDAGNSVDLLDNYFNPPILFQVCRKIQFRVVGVVCKALTPVDK